GGGDADLGHDVLLEDGKTACRQVPLVKAGKQPGEVSSLIRRGSGGCLHREVSCTCRAAWGRSSVTCPLAWPGSGRLVARCCRRARARDNRDRTVPTGIPSASAAAA